MLANHSLAGEARFKTLIVVPKLANHSLSGEARFLGGKHYLVVP